MTDLHFDVSAFGRTSEHFSTASKMVPVARNRAINHTGMKARTKMKSALVVQTGLKARTMEKALRVTRASIGNGGTFTIKAKGGDTRLHKFAAKETRAGVSAAPWRSRRIYAGTFIKGGHFPNRVDLKKGGVVFQRTGKARYPIRVVHSGLFLPDEMVSGQSAEAFYRTVDTDLPSRMAHELERIL